MRLSRLLCLIFERPMRREASTRQRPTATFVRYFPQSGLGPRSCPHSCVKHGDKRMEKQKKIYWLLILKREPRSCWFFLMFTLRHFWFCPPPPLQISSFSPVLCVCCTAAQALSALLSSSLIPVLLESTHTTSALLDFTSCCDATDVADDDARVVTSPGDRRGK